MAEFNPGQYADRRREKILDLLKKKVKEQARVEAPVVEEAEGEGPPDLIAALEESMRQVKENR
jgi:DNA end-binding protein Ku